MKGSRGCLYRSHGVLVNGSRGLLGLGLFVLIWSLRVLGFGVSGQFRVSFKGTYTVP